ncbi:MAG: hypothetical protein K8S99_00930 [Planctomycetes bacterium]|nr:hypothetical protein [Planctomycetota bacterium]
MIPRPDLLDARSPKGVEVFQLTNEKTVPSTHVYMEAQIFSPDSKHFILHRSSHAHGSEKSDPEHRYMLCEVATGKITPLTDEVGPTTPSVSPDGKWFYYLVNQTEVNAGKLTLRRRPFMGGPAETIVVVDKPPTGTLCRPSHVYPLSTISSDGKRFVTACYFGDGRRNYAPWGLLKFDIERATAEVILEGQSFCNLHPQYSRSLDPERSHDLLIQDNHDNVTAPDGTITKGCGSWGDGSPGADIHVIRDDGTDFRNLPWGRNMKEACQGHQCWRGRSDVAISTVGRADKPVEVTHPSGDKWAAHEEQIVEGNVVPYAGHVGVASPGAQRHEVSRNFPGGPSRFFHFATDIAGERFIVDYNPLQPRGCQLWMAELGKPLSDAPARWTYLLDTRTAFYKSAHPHPFLSPDGKTAFFNSDESGIMQAYMIRGV